MFAQTAVRRRLVGKQPPGGPDATDAVAAERQAADGLAALPGDARRQHVHWTMVASQRGEDMQPGDLTRSQFWRHLLRCYQDAYPKADSPTGCILQFACVASEKHHNAPKWEDRCNHFHAACFTTEKHYWRKVRRVSAERYHIQLNAVAHDCYSTMYTYLRKATKRKPLHELDTHPYHSPRHPKGDALKALLEAGETYEAVRGRKRSAAEASGPAHARSPFGVFFQWVTTNKCHGPKGAVRVERDAVRELREGRPQLLEFVRKNSSSLPDLIDYCWSLDCAEQRLERMELSRVDILLKAAIPDVPFCANGAARCAAIYDSILSHQDIQTQDFCHSLYDTCLHGRRKGNAMMLVGGKDTGKTTLTEPAACIFRTMQTPQSDSFCPMQDARGFELYLWHDFRYSPGHPKKEEQGLRLDEGTWNRLLEGLPTRIGVAKSDSSRTDFVFHENTPFIFTGPFKLAAYRNGRFDPKETEQLSCRLKYWEFAREAPDYRDRSFKPCAACWARWVLRGEMDYRVRAGQELDDFLARAHGALGRHGAAAAAAPPAPQDPQAALSANHGGVAQPGLPVHPPVHARGLPQPVAGNTEPTASAREWFARLEKLMDWRAQGFLTEREFVAAKARLGLHQ